MAACSCEKHRAAEPRVALEVRARAGGEAGRWRQKFQQSRDRFLFLQTSVVMLRLVSKGNEGPPVKALEVTENHEVSNPVVSEPACSVGKKFRYHSVQQLSTLFMHVL